MSHLVRRGRIVATSMAATVALACGAVASSTATPDTSSASPPAPSASNPEESDPTDSSSVTLLTGDVVEVTATDGGRPVVNVDAVSGSVQRYTVGSDIYIVPEVAQPYLAAGTVDDQLFNVTKLLEYGYDDASVDTIPLIATYDHARSTPSTPVGADVVRPLESIGGAALAADKDTTDDLWTSLTGDAAQARATTASGDLDGGFDTLWLDGHVESTLDVSVPQVHAPEAWEAGFDGTGATVAVLDSGIDAEHPDITNALTDAVSFVPDEEATDVNGHGTHVASTVLGDGTASDGLNQGVAPGAELKVGKVLADNGFGQDSWLIAGMEWAADNADVVNMSLGDSSRTNGQDPLSLALNGLTEETDTLFVVAAGNDGAAGTIGAPGAADKALTVGAVDDNDERTWFTSMGPRTGDSAIKPDLSAPGEGIVAARSQFAAGEGAYQSMDGTSMASPHVAGAAAIVRTAHPEWTAAQVKSALMSTTDPLEATPYELGAGRLNVAAAVTGEVTATGSAFFGRFEYPHDGDDPVERTITYTNHGDTEVTLALSAEMSSADGPTDMVTLSSSELTVPAGGSADVVATADPDAVSGSGQFTGFAVATIDGADLARTALALDKEEERYNVDVTVLGPDGEPATGEVTFYRYGDQRLTTLPVDPTTGAIPTQRIAPGYVNATAVLDVAGESGPDSEGRLLLGDPHIDATGSDVEVVFDARDAVAVSLETPEPSETQVQQLEYFHDSGIGGDYATFSALYEYGPDVTDLYAVPTGPVDGEMYDFTATWRNTAPLLEVSAFTPRRTELDPIYQQGSVRLDGRVDLYGVDAGAGTAEEYANIDAEGKAVVVTRSDDVAPADRAAAAQDAGAALLIVANDERGRLFEFAGGTDLPVVAVTAAEGEVLRQGAEFDRLRFRGAATEFTPYMYTITEGWPGEIPSDPTLAPSKDDLARIDSRFIGDGQRIAFSTISHCRDYQWPPCMSTGSEPQSTHTARIDYLSTDDGNTWYMTASDEDGWEQRGVNRSYEPGSVTPMDWFSPVVRPRLGDGYWGSRFNEDWFAMNVPPSSGQHGITGSRGQGYDDRIATRLYQEGELIDSSASQSVQTRVPVAEGPVSYRYEMDTVAAEDEPWANSTRTSSAWDFVADQAAQPGDDSWAYLPLLQLDYELDLELDGSADPPKRDVIGVSASHEEGVVGGGDVVDMTLEVSYDDGTTWTDVPLRANGTGVVFYPENASWVSLRATAQDDAGNGVEQEIIRAYSLD